MTDYFKLLKNAVGHFYTITKHKKLVMEGCFKVGLYKQGLLHDMSKYTWQEFKTGVIICIRAREAQMRRKENIWAIPRHGFIIKAEISIITSIGQMWTDITGKMALSV